MISRSQGLSVENKDPAEPQSSVTLIVVSCRSACARAAAESVCFRMSKFARAVAVHMYTPLNMNLSLMNLYMTLLSFHMLSVSRGCRMLLRS